METGLIGLDPIDRQAMAGAMRSGRRCRSRGRTGC